MENKKISRSEAEIIVDKILDANFQMYGLGNFDISRDEFVNIIMISVNGSDKEDCLQRYYKILHDKVFGRNIYNIYIR